MDEIEYLGATSTIQSYNLFTYCEGNPVMGYDPMGTWTISFNLNLNLNIFFGVSISIGFSIDSKGESALQYSYSCQPLDSETSNIGLLDTGGSFSIQYTNLDSVDDLEGNATYIGGSIGAGLYASGDIIADAPASDPNGKVIGGQIGIGYGIGVDAHIIYAKTKTIRKNFKGTFGWFI